MWDKYEIQYYIGKIINSIVCGVFIGLSLKCFNNWNAILRNKKMFVNKKDLRLILFKIKKFSREYIVSLGREAIWCENSKQILTEPCVLPNGKSYNKSTLSNIISKDKLYENRSLKEFVQILKLKYNLK